MSLPRLRSEQLAPVPAAKLTLPALPPRFLARPQLHHQLAQWRHHRLTVISAPPGYGKTSLVAHLLHDPGEPAQSFQPAWLTLDEDDDEPLRFVTALAAALADLIPPAVETAAQHALAAAQPRQALRLLLAAPAQATEDVLLILDNLHCICRRDVHALLSLAIEHSPAHLHWMLLTRHAAPIALGKLRLQGQLLELDCRSLRLERREIGEFLAQAGGIGPEPAVLELLEQRTQGWIAGIKLALLPLPQSASADEKSRALLDLLHGDNPLLADYLTAEVLAQQTVPMYTFLIQCSVLERLHPDLCRAVTGMDEAEQLLQQAVDERLFLQQVDLRGEWFEFHGLFRGLLRRQLRRQLSAAAIRDLFLKAAAWFEQRGDMAASLRCLLDGGAPDLAAELVQNHSRPALLQERWAELDSWLRLLPAAQIDARPQLLLDRAWLALLTGSHQAEAALVHAHDLLRAGPAPSARWRDELKTLELLRRLYGQDRAELEQDTRRAIEHFDAESQLALAWAYTILAQMGAGSRPGTGAHDYAQLALDAFDAARLPVGQLQVRLSEAAACRQRGDPQRCLAQCWEALEHPSARRPEVPAAAALNNLAGETLYWLDRLGEAAACFRRTLAMVRSEAAPLPYLEAQLCLQLCRPGDTQAQPTPAMLQEEDLIWPAAAVGPGASARLVFWQMQRWLALGEKERAWQSYLRLGVAVDALAADAPPALWLTVLTAHVTCGRLGPQLAPALQRLQRRAQEAGDVHLDLQVGLLTARHLQLVGSHAAARAQLRRSLSGVEKTGCDRLVLVHPELAPVLSAVGSAYARTLLPRMGAVHRQPERPELTGQEQVILGLMVDELNVDQIAARLVLAPSTVKWHMHKIYSKLGVRNRRQAVALAGQMRLPAANS